MILERIKPGQYKTPDGHYLVEQEDYERECECVACQVGNFCSHGGIAKEKFWHIWDTETDDYMEGTTFTSFKTLAEAREHLT